MKEASEQARLERLRQVMSPPKRRGIICLLNRAKIIEEAKNEEAKLVREASEQARLERLRQVMQLSSKRESFYRTDGVGPFS